MNTYSWGGVFFMLLKFFLGMDYIYITKHREIRYGVVQQGMYYNKHRGW